MDKRKIKIIFEEFEEDGSIVIQGKVSLYSRFYITEAMQEQNEIDFKNVAKREVCQNINDYMYREFFNRLNELQSQVYCSIDEKHKYYYDTIREQFEKAIDSLPEFVIDG